MQLDLRQSAAAIREHIAQRAKSYAKRRNKGPGKPGDPVTQITIGYQFDQAGWFALVFDTRPGSEVDGEWNSYIEANACRYPAWKKAFSSLGKEGPHLRLIEHNGHKKMLGSSTDEVRFAKYLGVTIRDVLVEASENGVFDGVPLAEECELVVEEHGGYFGWSSASKGKATEASHLKKLDGQVATKTGDGQIAHWIDLLNKAALGNAEKSEWSYLDVDYAMGKLKRFGHKGMAALLKFVKTWSGEQEWAGDRPKRRIDPQPMHGPTIDALMFVCKSKGGTPQMEALLRDILSRSVKANAGRNLWGLIPVWSARCLSALFDTYPEPEQNERTNALVNHGAFTSSVLRRR